MLVHRYGSLSLRKLCFIGFLELVIFCLCNSHLVIQTSQSIQDVPYGDYFEVEVLSIAMFLLNSSSFRYL
ncbi:hypothetical protein GW17_00000244 [Ensete ventricosum]|nr:hypothetical protein GW17_00000244 [Ensete ventricosum]